ncbi:hypothetical protein [Candidatus Synchoanobacter obligatus]|nr:hypothetical protein [Candidatus Synchoanobacter obligatus]
MHTIVNNNTKSRVFLEVKKSRTQLEAVAALLFVTGALVFLHCC